MQDASLEDLIDLLEYEVQSLKKSNLKKKLLIEELENLNNENNINE